MKIGFLKWLIPASILLGAGIFVKTGLKLQKLNIFFKSVRYKGMSLGRINLAIDIVIENPNPKQLTLQEIEATIFHQGEKLTGISLYDQNIPLPGRQPTTVSGISVKIESMQFAEKVLDFITGGFKDAEIEIRGHIKADGLIFPFSETTTIV